VNKLLLTSILLFSFGCSTEQSRTLFVQQSLSFRDETLSHYNSARPDLHEHITIDSYYDRAKETSTFLIGSGPVMRQMYITLMTLNDYRFAFAIYRGNETSFRGLPDCKEAFKKEIDKLTLEIEIFSPKNK
jgi:hypothetical protein